MKGKDELADEVERLFPKLTSDGGNSIDTPNELADEVERFLMGPREHEEELPQGEMPLDWYVSGILFPRNAELDAEDKDDDKDSSGNEKGSEQNVLTESTNAMFKQNSIGLRAELRDDCKKVSVEISYGKYSQEDSKWKRTRLDTKMGKVGEIELKQGRGKFSISSEDDGEVDAEVNWQIERGNASGKQVSVLNIFLENPRIWQVQSEEKDYKFISKENNKNSIFQPMIRISGVGNEKPFTHIEDMGKIGIDDDAVLDMLFRKKKTFATGYGCAAKWENDMSPRWVESMFVPRFVQKEIGKASDSDGKDGRPVLIDMYEMSGFEKFDDEEFNRADIREKLEPLVIQYKKWIEGLENRMEKEFDGSTDEFHDAANDNVKKCKIACKRIEDGLKLLTAESRDDSSKIVKAFLLANRAMLYQGLYFDYALGKSKGQKISRPDTDKPGQRFWFPFQIAFMLMTLRGIVDKEHDDAEIADLLWFPTGGGKTEAYLGVAAFTIILRRLRGEVDGLGVSVIMRYTLRLLTLQQFERSSTLFCALEFIRKNARDNLGLGEQPFLLGMWVGYSLTPNSSDKSLTAINKLKKDRFAETPDGSPWQTNYCPWCGKEVGPHNYWVDSETKWTKVKCMNGGCYFSDSLPLVTVDEDIYTRCPSMIIATADKFARMAFRHDIASMFGRAEKWCTIHGFTTKRDMTYEKSKCRCSTVRDAYDIESKRFPPDLIIQDELHLISGSLGTMVGLYETAVDYLTGLDKDGKTIRPKVIASTATTRGTREQMKKIFNRKGGTAEFPPPAFDRKDSFFWWETNVTGRLHVGVSFSHKSGKFALGKIFSSLLQRISTIKDAVDESKMSRLVDPYWTLVGYYNSIRELGGSNRLVEDDVPDGIELITGLIDKKVKKREVGVQYAGIEELTGRKTQREINELRVKLEKSFPDENTINVLLSTNMISVGIDVGRLGLMVVNGQPKNSTEYIQATGRIGRKPEIPGAVFVLYNPYKPRDLSQYENFVGYHNTMQKYVEPAILTPFSLAACKRAIHAVFISMIRLSIPEMSGTKDANDFTKSMGKDIEKFILERFKSIQDVDEDSRQFQDMKDMLDDFQTNWEKFIQKTKEDDKAKKKGVWYNNPYSPEEYRIPKNENVLMIEFSQAGATKIGKFPMSTPESLREVERQMEMKYV